MITDEHFSALQGMFPSWITTCSAAGEPKHPLFPKFGM